MRRFAVYLFGVIFAAWLAAGPAASPALASDRVKWKNDATILSEYDDNVYKTTRNIQDDFLARIFFDSRLDLLVTPTNTFTADYTLGAKKFFDLDDQDTLINQIMLQYVNSSLRNTYVGGDASLKLRNIRDGDEDYNKFIASAFLGRYLSRSVTGQLTATYTRFDFENFDYYDYWSQAYGVEVKKTFSHALSLGTHYTIEENHYPFAAFENVVSDQGSIFLQEKDELRVDSIHQFGLFVNSFYYVLINFNYDLEINDSNSYGDTFYHHRLRLALSKALAKGTNLHLFAVANFRDSYQEVLIPHSYAIEEDDENYNQVVVKLNHRLLDWLWLEARYGRFWSQYSVREFDFRKDVYSLGVSFTF